MACRAPDVASVRAAEYAGLQHASLNEDLADGGTEGRSPRASCRVRRGLAVCAAALCALAFLALRSRQVAAADADRVGGGGLHVAATATQRSLVDLAVAAPNVDALLQGLKAKADAAAGPTAGAEAGEVNESSTPMTHAQSIEQMFDGLQGWVTEQEAAAADAKKHLADAQAAYKTAASVKGYFDESRSLRVAECTLNVLQAAQYLARAGLQLNAATLSCRNQDTSYKQQACAADAAGVFASVAWVATYLSLAASQCGRVANVPAVCAATIEGIVASLSSVAVQANFVAANCGIGVENKTRDNTHTDAVWQLATRRLEEDESEYTYDDKIPRARDAEMATCIFDYTTAATALAQMGVGIRSAVRSCALYKATGNNRPPFSKITEDVCALDIGHILYSVGQAASFISVGTSHCYEGMSAPALCAGGMAGMLTTMAGVIYMGSGMDLACTNLPKLGPLQTPVATLLAQGFARRLSPAQSSADKGLV